MRKVVCAAIRGYSTARGEILITGARHFDKTMVAMIKHLEIPISGDGFKQGFIDQWGYFMDRKEAFEVAKEAGQILKKSGNPLSKELFSEDLY